MSSCCTIDASRLFGTWGFPRTSTTDRKTLLFTKFSKVSPPTIVISQHCKSNAENWGQRSQNSKRKQKTFLPFNTHTNHVKATDLLAIYIKYVTSSYNKHTCDRSYRWSHHPCSSEWAASTHVHKRVSSGPSVSCPFEGWMASIYISRLDL